MNRAVLTPADRLCGETVEIGHCWSYRMLLALLVRLGRVVELVAKHVIRFISLTQLA